VIRLVADRFPALADVFVDERLTVASADGASRSGSASRSRRPVSPYRVVCAAEFV
jgi:hypothetical protein